MGNRPIRWRFANKTAHWDPRRLVGFAIDTVLSKSVGAAIRARICAILLGRPLLGWGAPVRSPGAVELESWSSARRALDPFLLRQVLLCVFLGSACLSGLNLCHTDSSCSGRLGVGDDDCSGAVAWKRSGLSRQLTEYSLHTSQPDQPAGLAWLVWLHNYGVRLPSPAEPHFAAGMRCSAPGWPRKETL